MRVRVGLVAADAFTAPANPRAKATVTRLNNVFPLSLICFSFGWSSKSQPSILRATSNLLGVSCFADHAAGLLFISTSNLSENEMSLILSIFTVLQEMGSGRVQL